jgi:hypothetical protein
MDRRPQSHDPIAVYLHELRHSLRTQRDAADLVAETEDHLREALRCRLQAGEDPVSAYESVLTRFGDADLVARTLVRSRSHCVPMATPLTRRAGAAGRWAAVAWSASVALGVLQLLQPPWSQGYWTAFAVAVFVGILLTALLVVGLVVRAGAGRSAWSLLVVLLVLTASAAGPMAWMWPIFLPALSLALWVALRLCRAAELPHGRSRNLLLVAVWPSAGLVAYAGLALGIGPMDTYLEHPLLYNLAYPVAAVLFAVGCWTLGRALAAERLTGESCSVRSVRSSLPSDPCPLTSVAG